MDLGKLKLCSVSGHIVAFHNIFNLSNDRKLLKMKYLMKTYNKTRCVSVQERPTALRQGNENIDIDNNKSN